MAAGFGSSKTLMPMARACVGASALVACSASHHAVVIDTGGETPAFAMYKDGQAAWASPEPDPSGYRLSVEDDYDFVKVCVGPEGTFDAEELLATADDGDLWYIGSYLLFPDGGCQPTPDQRPTHIVSGTMTQPGTVTVGSSGSSSGTAAWPYSLQVHEGEQDLMAVSGNAIALRRNQDVVSDLTEPNIDISSEGVPLQDVSIAVSHSATSMLSANVSLTTQFGGGFVSSVPAPSSEPVDVQVAPQTLLMADDQQMIMLSTSTGNVLTGAQTVDQSATIVFDGTQTSADFIEAPMVLFGDTSSPFVVAWQAVDDDYFELSFTSLGCSLSTCATQSYQSLTVTKSWLAKHDLDSISFNAQHASGYDPAWALDANHGIYINSLDEERFTSVYKADTSVNKQGGTP